MVFVITNIIEDQHIAGLKSFLLHFFENTKQIQDWKVSNTSTTAHKVFSEVQFKKLLTGTIEKFQTQLKSIMGQKVPFVGTSPVALTHKFR